MTQRGNIGAVVFDMGGVLVELGPMHDVFGGKWGDVAEFWPRWLASSTVRDLDTGTISPDAFCARLIDEFDLPFTQTEMIERLRGWPRGLFDGAADLVRSLDGVVETAVLSNTSSLHWETQVDHQEVQALFPRRYLSYQLGMVKPDAEIFEHVIHDLGFDAVSILFLDDNQINVDGALAAGMKAQRCVGVPDASVALRSHGVTT